MEEKKYIIKAYNILNKRKDIQYIAQEVPILGRYVDLVFIKDNKIYTIEFKLNNCKKALTQSKDHMLGADFCYICMPPRKFKDEFLKSVSVAGVGLFTFQNNKEWPFLEMIKAKKSKKKYNFVWKKTYNYCNKFAK